MEHAGILDHRSETDLYCLHKVFFSLMRKSVRTHVESWNLHKHRSLRHKSPSFVFKEALRALKIYSSNNNNKRFTELRLVLPRITICHLRLPLFLVYVCYYVDKLEIFWKRYSLHQKSYCLLQRQGTCGSKNTTTDNRTARTGKIGITWRNAVKRYINIRKYVQKLILRNENM